MWNISELRSILLLLIPIVFVQVNASLESSQFQIDFFKQAKIFDVDNLTNSTQKRLLESVLDIGTDALGDQGKLKEVCWDWSQIKQFSEVYSTYQIIFILISTGTWNITV